MFKVREVDSVEIVTLVEDYAGYETSFLAQHGISILLDAKSGDVHKRVLMDVGQSSEPILHNMGILGIDPTSIDMIFLSHCHYDHTRGLVGMLQAIQKEDIPIIAHPTIFRENYVLKPYLRHIGITEENSRERIKESGGCLFLVKEPFELLPGVISTGEVERTTDFEEAQIGSYNVENGELVEDQILDDMSIVVNAKGKGLVIVIGCGHAGLINIIKHSTKITGVNRIEGVVGGFHLIEASKERIEKTVEALSKLDLGWVFAGHCTGFAANKAMSTALGD
ncbi:MAG: MBL fold metallo-hydrolase, partial [Chloroflexota bacterium]|nr:MBL fold metallo-hydrolase [Chloroflexota bacterium]